MEERKQALRAALTVIAVVLAVTAALVLIFFGGARQTEHDTITLPEPSPAQPVQEQQTPQPAQDLFAEVTRQNVQDVLRSLQRPSSYHQTYVVITYAGGSKRQQQVDIWRSGALIRAESSDSYGTQSILSDGETLYLWYDGDTKALCIPLGEDRSVDDFIGIATYESILSLPPEQIENADFVTLQNDTTLSCVSLRVQMNGYLQEYWVDVNSGLLCRQTMLQNERPVYTMQQTLLEILIDGDETLSGAFCLPDGSEPFVAD